MKKPTLGRKLLATALLASSAASLAYGQGQVNGAGASLFVDFFRTPAATNDFLDVDGDGNFGPSDTNGDGIPDSADQLANSNPFNFTSFGANQVSQTWFLLQYRSIGSVRGFNELSAYQLCGDLPEDIPSERGIINRNDYAVTGVVVWAGSPGSCTDDTDGDGIANESGTPVCPTSIDFATTDVQTTWATQGTHGTATDAAWSRNPTELGYGQNPGASNGDASQSGFPTVLGSLERDCNGDGTIDAALNTNTAGPDLFTVFDTTVAFSPIAVISNRGTGVDTLRYTQLQHLFLTGRLPNGENLVGATRDVSSGTRNAFSNPLNMDPSWAVGDHVGVRISTKDFTNLGPLHQANNCGGSSIMENAIQNRRLAVGYTGLVGGSRAAADALGGKYEVLSVIKDLDVDGDGGPDGTHAVRPGLSTILDNANADTGYQIGGLETLSTVGNPNANRDPADPLFNATDPPMSNQTAAEFINNIISSINEFQDPLDPNAVLALMPGQLLAQDFFLEAAVSAVPNPLRPVEFVPNPIFNQTLHDFIRNQSNLNLNDTPAYGSINAAGLVPKRASLDGFDPNDPNLAYSDGSVTGEYRYTVGGSGHLIGAGGQLSASNALAGDFNRDGVRDIDDTPAMLTALRDPAHFDTVDHGGNRGDMSADVIIPEVIGDFDGDGNFDADDVRYFADGLAISGGKVDHKAAFARVDNEWAAQGQGSNFFGTTLATCKTYAAGDSRGDIAGNAYVTPGAAPTGHDGRVDSTDIAYVAANFGAWSDLDEAVSIDLSADLNGDLIVDAADITELVESILGTRVGDLNLDGAVELSDLAVMLSNFGSAAGAYEQGDVDGDGFVTLSDLALLLSNFGSNTCP